MKPELSIIYDEGRDGWWIATIPEVPGALSQGKTKADARQNALDALEELMVARRELALKERGAGAVCEPLTLAG